MNISFVIEETDTNEEQYDSSLFYIDTNDNIQLKEECYNNLTIKQLLVISDYYGLTKKYRLTKSNKIDIIMQIVLFETDPKNNIIVNRRKKMWFYIEEIKNDKIMSKYIML